MTHLTTRLLSLLLCLILLAAAPLALATQAAAPEEADFIPEDLSPEDRQQWEEWSALEAQEAEKADESIVLSPEDEAALAELITSMEDSVPLETVDVANLYINEELPDHVINILLLGVDNRTTELTRGLSDAIIICSINTKTGSLKLTSIARDLGVPVPGYKKPNRINVAYKFGGPELSMATINRNFNLNIQQYVVVNIHGLADIIESLGGVDLDMTAKEAKRINYELRKEPMDQVRRKAVPSKAGVQHLDGMQAVTFARIRGIDSDLERTRRQRYLLEVLLQQVMKDMDLAKFAHLVETAMPHGTTNLTPMDLTRLAMAVLSGEAMTNLQGGSTVMEQLRIPIDKHFSYQKVGQASAFYLNPENLQFTLDTMQEFMYGE